MLQCRKILIPTDGSQASCDVIDFICSTQYKTNAEINVAFMVEVPRSLPLGAYMPEKVEAARVAIARAMQIAESNNAVIYSSIVYARTAEDSILTTAQEMRCDVIAIAQDNEKLRIFANMASNIYQRAKCSVWLFNSK